MPKYRIMIIDDVDDTRKVLSLALRDRFEVVVACDGLDALSKLETHEPDLAIIDIMMPLMDGYQVCEAIRNHPRFKTMQVFFLSAYGSKDNIKKCYASGANLFLNKPVSPTRVLSNIEFTIKHDPPPMHHKRYTLAELQQLDIEQKRKARVEAQAKVQPKAKASAKAAPKPQPEREAPPAETAPKGPPSTPAEVESKPAEPMVRILAVDDDPDTLRMIDLVLRDSYEITTACDGIEAIERLVFYEPDLMLIDIMMPKMNGYQVLQSIRRNVYLHQLPIVVISAKAGAKDRDYATRLGATDFMAKPYSVEELIGVVHKVTSAPGFKTHKKKNSIFDIKERAFAEGKAKSERMEEMERRRKYAQLRGVFDPDKERPPP